MRAFRLPSSLVDPADPDRHRIAVLLFVLLFVGIAMLGALALRVFQG